MGKYTEAEKLDIQVLDARNRILGVEHQDTIHAIGSPATTYEHLRKYTEAEELEIQVLDEKKNRILGAMTNLAATYHNLGLYVEAEKLKIGVLDVMNRILGVEHSDTIYGMGSAAATYQHLGKYTETEKLEIQVLDPTNHIIGIPWVMETSGITTLQKTVATVQEQTQSL